MPSKELHSVEWTGGQVTPGGGGDRYSRTEDGSLLLFRQPGPKNIQF